MNARPGSNSKAVKFRPRGAGLVFVLLLTAPFGGLFAQIHEGLTFYFSLQATRPSESDLARLREFTTGQNADVSFLIQGYGCDIGGFEPSHLIARSRGRTLADILIRAGIDPDRVLVGEPIVYYGQPRGEHRKVELSTFKDGAGSRVALARANARAGQINAETRRTLTATEAARHEHEERAAVSATPAGSGAGALFGLRSLALLALAALALGAVFLIWRARQNERQKRESHRLTPEESEALEILTGGAVRPLSASPAKKEGRIINRITRRDSMAKKKVKKQITPFNIQGAVSKEFEGATLGQLQRAPIHALEGLTPRHAMLLKEGFGVQTVEDLARLKYFEIARAITVLAKYEQ